MFFKMLQTLLAQNTTRRQHKGCFVIGLDEHPLFAVVFSLFLASTHPCELKITRGSFGEDDVEKGSL